MKLTDYFTLKNVALTAGLGYGLYSLYNGYCAPSDEKINKVYQQAVRQFELGEDSRAKTDFEYVLKHYGQTPALLIYLGLIHFRDPDYEASKEFFKKCLATHAYETGAYYVLGLISSLEKKSEHALAYFKAASTAQTTDLWDDLFKAYATIEFDPVAGEQLFVKLISTLGKMESPLEFKHEILLPHAKFGLAQSMHAQNRFEEADLKYRIVKQEYKRFHDLFAGESIDSHIFHLNENMRKATKAGTTV